MSAYLAFTTNTQTKMTQRQTITLIDKLIGHYYAAIKAIESARTLQDARQVLNIYNVSIGVCACAYHEFGISIHEEKWVLDNTNTGAYWYPLPISADYRPNIIKRLSYRISILISVQKEFKKKLKSQKKKTMITKRVKNYA